MVGLKFQGKSEVIETKKELAIANVAKLVPFFIYNKKPNILCVHKGKQKNSSEIANNNKEPACIKTAKKYTTIKRIALVFLRIKFKNSPPQK